LRWRGSQLPEHRQHYLERIKVSCRKDKTEYGMEILRVTKRHNFPVCSKKKRKQAT